MQSFDLMIGMRDGVSLKTTVFLPSNGEGPWPLLLERTPYGRLGKRPGEKAAHCAVEPTGADVARAFCSHGFAVALQDCRGRYDSEGNFEKYSHESNDSFDTIEALAAMEWCSGWVASYGQSYAALVQSAVGPLSPPALEAQVIDSGGFTNAWRNGLRHNGVLEMKQAVWIVREASNSSKPQNDQAHHYDLTLQDFNQWLERMPWRSGYSPISAHPEYEDLLIDLFDPKPGDVSWLSPALATERHFEAYKKIPVLFMSSWYDPYARTISEMYAGLKARQPCHIVLGPWTHCDQNNQIAGDVDFGADSLLDSWAGSWIDYRANFFFSAMKGEAFSAPPARVFLMGGGSGTRTAHGHLDHGGQWFEPADWPVPDAQIQSLYLAVGGRLEPTPGEASTRTFDYDPKDPVPTVGGDFSSFSPYLTAGPYDQVVPAASSQGDRVVSKLEDRNDICVFRTDALSEDLSVAGPIEYDVWVSTEADDTDFTLKLIDEYPPSNDYPDGYAMLIGDTIVRLKYARNHQRERINGTIQIKGTLCWTANRFAAGHRVRVDISSSNFPKFEKNLCPQDSASPDTARNTIHLGGAELQSRISLPILPKRYWK